MDTPLFALRMLFGNKMDLIKYVCFGLYHLTCIIPHIPSRPNPGQTLNVTLLQGHSWRRTTQLQSSYLFTCLAKNIMLNNVSAFEMRSKSNIYDEDMTDLCRRKVQTCANITRNYFRGPVHSLPTSPIMTTGRHLLQRLPVQTFLAAARRIRIARGGASWSPV